MKVLAFRHVAFEDVGHIRPVLEAHGIALECADLYHPGATPPDITQADALILTPIPFGSGNLANLELLDQALTAGKPVFIASGIEERDFTPTRQAEQAIRALLLRGAKPYQDVAELLTLLPFRSST